MDTKNAQTTSQKDSRQDSLNKPEWYDFAEHEGMFLDDLRERLKIKREQREAQQNKEIE